MNREDLVGQKVLHYDWGMQGVILDVNFDARPQTAKFLPEDRAEDMATWVNLISLKLLPESTSDRD